MILKEFIKRYPIILTECSVIERIKREFEYDFETGLLNNEMLYNEKGKLILNLIYSQYLETAKKANLPIILLTPTWRANKETIEKAGRKFSNSNILAFRFLDHLRTEQKGINSKILIGGLTGCKGDAYKASDALSPDESYKFHSFQSEQLKNAGVDFLIAATLPALSEAKGIAKAFASQKIPYILSFIIKSDGKLLDGTYLSDAVEEIDNYVFKKPDYYMINCVHPDNLLKALSIKENDNDNTKRRIIGLQANSSTLNPEDLDNKLTLDKSNKGTWALSMYQLNKVNGLKILGGCCGTDNSFLQALTEKFIN